MKSETKQKLIERGWGELAPIQEPDTGELILDIDAMIKAEESERLSQVLRLCEDTEAQYLGALKFENSTHRIDSQTCTWKLLDYEQECANFFDKIFDTWTVHVKGNYGGPGQPILEPPSVVGLIVDWEGGEEFRDSDSRYTVNDWAYLVKHHEQVWGHVDWPKLESFSYIESEVENEN